MSEAEGATYVYTAEIWAWHDQLTEAWLCRGIAFDPNGTRLFVNGFGDTRQAALDDTIEGLRQLFGDAARDVAPSTQPSTPPDEGRLMSADQVADELFGGQVTAAWVKRNLMPGRVILGHRTVRWLERPVRRWIDLRRGIEQAARNEGEVVDAATLPVE